MIKYSIVFSLVVILISTSTNWAQESIELSSMESWDKVVQVSIETSLKGNEELTNQRIKYISNQTNIVVDNQPTSVLKAIEGWGNLKLGLNYDEINAVLTNEYAWVSLRKIITPNFVSNNYFLESYKNDYFNKMQFQFDENNILYLLRLELNPRFFSFIQLYNSLVEKYGYPQENSYVRVIWQDSFRSIELYRNNVLVYVDKTNWEEKLPISEIEDRRKELLDSVFDNL